MPLDASILATEIRKFTDETFEDFQGFPEDATQTAEAWSEALFQFGKDVTPVSATAMVAKGAAKTVFSGLNNPATGLLAFKGGFDAFALALAGGMAGFAAVPPPAQIDFSAIFPLGVAGASAKVVADGMSQVALVWFKTGTATPLPAGSPVQWS